MTKVVAARTRITQALKSAKALEGAQAEYVETNQRVVLKIAITRLIELGDEITANVLMSMLEEKE